MDPTTCLKLILEHLEDGDTESAHWSAYNLDQWLKGGGFPPDFSTLSESNRRKLAQCLVLAVVASYLT